MIDLRGAALLMIFGMVFIGLVVIATVAGVAWLLWRLLL